MVTVDWELIKLQYEMFGSSLEEISADTAIPMARLEYAAAEGNWRQTTLPVVKTDVQKIASLPTAEARENLLEEINERIGLQNIVKTSALAPQYASAEARILRKAVELIQSIADEANGPAKLKILTDVITMLKSQNPVLAPAKEAAGGGGTSLKVVIQNKFDLSGNDVQETVIEVPAG